MQDSNLETVAIDATETIANKFNLDTFLQRVFDVKLMRKNLRLSGNNRDFFKFI